MRMIHRTFLHTDGMAKQAKSGQIKGLDWMQQSSSTESFCRSCVTSSIDKRRPDVNWFRKKRRRIVRRQEKKITKIIDQNQMKYDNRKTKMQSRLGHRIAFDLSTGWQLSFDGYRYAMAAVDLATRWQWRFALKRKTDVRLALKEIQRQLTVMAETCVPSVRPRMQNGKACIDFILTDGDGTHRKLKSKE